MAEENPNWGYTRIQGALTVVGRRVGRTTIARILKADGRPPVPERPTSWQTFLRAHWGAIAGADFFTTEVWTANGLVTFYTLFIIDLASRRVRILGSMPRPDGLFMHQMARALVFADEGPLTCHRVLVSEWADTARGTPLPTCHQRVRDALSTGAATPGAQQHLADTVSTTSAGWAHSMPAAIRRDAQLLGTSRMNVRPN